MGRYTYLRMYFLIFFFLCILTSRVRTLVHNGVHALHHVRLFVTTAKTHIGHGYNNMYTGDYLICVRACVCIGVSV